MTIRIHLANINKTRWVSPLTPILAGCMFFYFGI